MRLVDEAFAAYARAERLCRTEEERLLLFMHRGSVSLGVPEGVFGKSAAGADDFLSAAEIYSGRHDEKGVESALLNAAACFDRAGKTGEAEAALVRAASLGNRSARTVYELARRGIELE